MNVKKIFPIALIAVMSLALLSGIALNGANAAGVWASWPGAGTIVTDSA